MAIPTLLGSVTLIFLIMRILPGDVAMAILSPSGEAVDPVKYNQLVTELGLNQPLWQQYFTWLWGFLQGDLGTSLFYGTPVWELIGVRMPYTMALVVLSLCISVVLAIPIGVLSAVKQDTWVDYGLRTFAIVGLAIPNFLFGVLVVTFAIVAFKWSPPLIYSPIYQDPAAAFQQLILPALVLGYRSTGVAARMVRSSMLEVMREDYIRTARSKGIPENRVVGLHALRNAVLPVVTMFGLEIILIFSATVIIEQIFNIPGIGSMLVVAIGQRDFITVQGTVSLIVIFVVLVNLLVDILNAAIDPRIRVK